MGGPPGSPIAPVGSEDAPRSSTASNAPLLLSQSEIANLRRILDQLEHEQLSVTIRPDESLAAPAASRTMIPAQGTRRRLTAHPDTTVVYRSAPLEHLAEPAEPPFEMYTCASAPADFLTPPAETDTSVPFSTAPSTASAILLPLVYLVVCTQSTRPIFPFPKLHNRP